MVGRSINDIAAQLTQGNKYMKREIQPLQRNTASDFFLGGRGGRRGRVTTLELGSQLDLLGLREHLRSMMRRNEQQWSES